MKRYIMGSGKPLALFSIIAIVLILIPFTIISIISGLFRAFPLAIVILILFLIPLIGTMIYGIKLENRKRIALAGVKKTGIVESVYPAVNRGNWYWVEYSYELFNHDRGLAAIKISIYDADLFEQEMEIPVYVGGEYGYCDIEEVRDKKLKEMAKEAREAQKDVVCKSCGKSYGASLDFCPFCGTRKEE